MGKCKYWKKCEWYDKESETCNKFAGMYYEDRPAGCWRRMREKELEKKNE